MLQLDNGMGGVGETGKERATMDSGIGSAYGTNGKAANPPPAIDNKRPAGSAEAEASKQAQQLHQQIVGQPTNIARRDGQRNSSDASPNDDVEPSQPCCASESIPHSPYTSTPTTRPAPTCTVDISSLPSTSLFKPVRTFTRTFPKTSCIVSRLPLTLIPFAFSMFILVESLQYTGWINVFANWWAAWVKVSGVAGSVWLMGVLSILGCNIFGTNIGATVLLSRLLQQWEATHSPVSPRTLYGAVFSLAIGSNFGAYSFVFSASLAGLLWRNILAQKGVIIAHREFIKWNVVPVVITTLVGCLVVAGEVCIIYQT